MDLKMQFVFCVQTLAIVRDIGDGRRQAHWLVGQACEATFAEIEQLVQDNEGVVADAANDFVQRQI